MPLRDAPCSKQMGAVGLWPPRDWDESHPSSLALPLKPQASGAIIESQSRIIKSWNISGWKGATGTFRDVQDALGTRLSECVWMLSPLCSKQCHLPCSTFHLKIFT